MTHTNGLNVDKEKWEQAVKSPPRRRITVADFGDRAAKPEPKSRLAGEARYAVNDNNAVGDVNAVKVLKSPTLDEIRPSPQSC